MAVEGTFCLGEVALWLTHGLAGDAVTSVALGGDVGFGEKAGERVTLAETDGGVMQRGVGSLLDFGSRRGSRKNRCLENAVLGLCRGELWERLRSRLAWWVRYEASAGLTGTVREARNLERVERALCAEGRR